MSNKQETVADIVREMRQAEANWHRSEIAQLPTQYLKEWSDRIEAAAKREREATREESSQVGNAAKMREALNQARRVLHCAIVAGILGGKDAHEALNGITAALSAPPRNCDRPECATSKAAQDVW